MPILTKKILVLGDCQSSGNNCIAHEVVGVDNCFLEWSLRRHKVTQQIIKWAMQTRKTQKINTPLRADQLESMAWQLLKQEEVKVAWPNLITNYHVINSSVNGAHFLGSHKRLIEALKEHKKFDLILLTDYAFSHRVISIKTDGQRQIYEKSKDYDDANWNPKLYDESRHQAILSGLAYQSQQSWHWFRRRHQHAHYYLTKSLRDRNMPFMSVRFGENDIASSNFFAELMHRQIDCSDLTRRYQSWTQKGEWSKTKLDTQPLIAQRVQVHLDNFFAAPDVTVSTSITV